MAGYPAKPWSNGQTAEIVPGETFEYDAILGAWIHVTKAVLDSDFQVEKATIEASIATNTSDISGLDTRVTTAEGNITTLQSNVSTLQSQVSLLDNMSDSETARIQQNIADINAAYAMLDSDSINIQGLRTDLQAEITATNSDVSALTGRLDSDEVVVQSLQTQINTLPMPVISGVQPTGATGLLWVNLNDGKLYYWNDSDATFTTIVTT